MGSRAARVCDRVRLTGARGVSTVNSLSQAVEAREEPGSMCGIAGIYRQDGAPPDAGQCAADAALVASMLRALEYRGPDDIGIEHAGRLTFGARRLSILDVEGGHQPLADAGGRIWAAQNGEIYNFPELRADLATRHPLRTRADTELLP
jgi:asparagine synthase (glutamine-hydrolysing)